jgi:hypothetical protein
MQSFLVMFVNLSQSSHTVEGCLLPHLTFIWPFLNIHLMVCETTYTAYIIKRNELGYTIFIDTHPDNSLCQAKPLLITRHEAIRQILSVLEQL